MLTQTARGALSTGFELLAALSQLLHGVFLGRKPLSNAG